MTNEELIAAVKKLQEKTGTDGEGVAAKLYGENYDLREKNRTHKAELDALRAKLPAEGAVLLAPAEAKAWEAYQKLGKAEDVQKLLADGKVAQEKLVGVAREKLIAEAAGAHGFKPSVLQKMPGVDALQLEVRETQRDGKTVKVAYVKDGAKETALDEHAKAQWADFLPALQAQQPASGTQYVHQDAGGKAPQSADLVDSFIENANKRASAKPNPLLPQTTKTGA